MKLSNYERTMSVHPNTKPINFPSSIRRCILRQLKDAKSGIRIYRNKTHFVFQQYWNHHFPLSHYFSKSFSPEIFAVYRMRRSIPSDDTARGLPLLYIRLIISRFVDLSFARIYESMLALDVISNANDS